MLNKLTLGFFLLTLFAGLAGALIGFGNHGTAQAASLGAGIGLCVPAVILAYICFLNSL